MLPPDPARALPAPKNYSTKQIPEEDVATLKQTEIELAVETNDPNSLLQEDYPRSEKSGSAEAQFPPQDSSKPDSSVGSAPMSHSRPENRGARFTPTTGLFWRLGKRTHHFAFVGGRAVALDKDTGMPLDPKQRVSESAVSNPNTPLVCTSGCLLHVIYDLEQHGPFPTGGAFDELGLSLAFPPSVPRVLEVVTESW